MELINCLAYQEGGFLGGHPGAFTVVSQTLHRILLSHGQYQRKDEKQGRGGRKKTLHHRSKMNATKKHHATTKFT